VGHRLGAVSQPPDDGGGPGMRPHRSDEIYYLY
jgi:hypothetical protein